MSLSGRQIVGSYKKKRKSKGAPRAKVAPRARAPAKSKKYSKPVASEAYGVFTGRAGELFHSHGIVEAKDHTLLAEEEASARRLTGLLAIVGSGVIFVYQARNGKLVQLVEMFGYSPKGSSAGFNKHIQDVLARKFPPLPLLPAPTGRRRRPTAKAKFQAIGKKVIGALRVLRIAAHKKNKKIRQADAIKVMTNVVLPIATQAGKIKAVEGGLKPAEVKAELKAIVADVKSVAQDPRASTMDVKHAVEAATVTLASVEKAVSGDSTFLVYEKTSKGWTSKRGITAASNEAALEKVLKKVNRKKTDIQRVLLAQIRQNHFDVFDYDIRSASPKLVKTVYHATLAQIHRFIGHAAKKPAAKRPAAKKAEKPAVAKRPAAKKAKKAPAKRPASKKAKKPAGAKKVHHIASAKLRSVPDWEKFLFGGQYISPPPPLRERISLSTYLQLINTRRGDTGRTAKWIVDKVTTSGGGYNLERRGRARRRTKAVKGKAPKAKAPKRKSSKAKAPKAKAPKRKASKGKAPKGKAPKRKPSAREAEITKLRRNVTRWTNVINLAKKSKIPFEELESKIKYADMRITALEKAARRGGAADDSTRSGGSKPHFNPRETYDLGDIVVDDGHEYKLVSKYNYTRGKRPSKDAQHWRRHHHVKLTKRYHGSWGSRSGGVATGVVEHIYKGKWNASATYHRGNIVEHSGKEYTLVDTDSEGVRGTKNSPSNNPDIWKGHWRVAHTKKGYRSGGSRSASRSASTSRASSRSMSRSNSLSSLQSLPSDMSISSAHSQSYSPSNSVSWSGGSVSGIDHDWSS